MINRDEQIRMAARLLRISYSDAKCYCSEIGGSTDIYVSVPEKGGSSVIVGSDGGLLFADSSVGYTKHVEEWKRRKEQK